MSSQGQGIPFYNIPSQSGFRLIEIPKEIETLLEGPDPPVLYLEPGEDDMATLRSPDHTYKLKQKNTSNGLFLIQPHTPNDPSSSPPQPGLASIAVIKETVELERVDRLPVNAPAPKVPRGKWHEMFGRDR